MNVQIVKRMSTSFFEESFVSDVKTSHVVETVVRHNCFFIRTSASIFHISVLVDSDWNKTLGTVEESVSFLYLGSYLFSSKS